MGVGLPLRISSPRDPPTTSHYISRLPGVWLRWFFQVLFSSTSRPGRSLGRNFWKKETTIFLDLSAFSCIMLSRYLSAASLMIVWILESLSEEWHTSHEMVSSTNLILQCDTSRLLIVMRNSYGPHSSSPWHSGMRMHGYSQSVKCWLI